jgi:hypothetical protein
MKPHNIGYWVRFGAVSTISALATVVLLNVSDAIATGNAVPKNLPAISAINAPDNPAPTTSRLGDDPNVPRNFREIGSPDELSGSIRKNEGVQPGKDGSRSGPVPTSMLWPAYKYIPPFSKTLRS